MGQGEGVPPAPPPSQTAVAAAAPLPAPTRVRPAPGAPALGGAAWPAAGALALVLALAGAAGWRTDGAAVSAPASLIVPERPPELGGRARVLGAGLDAALVATAGILTVDLHLQATGVVAENQPLALWLVGPDGRRPAEEVAGPGRGLRPTARWRPNELLVARTELRLRPGAEAGRYQLWAGLAGDQALVGAVDLPAAGAAPAAALASPFRRHESIFGPSLVLDGYTYDPDPSHGSLRASFWWRRVGDEDDGPHEATLRLVDRHGLELAAQTRPLGGAGQLRPEASFHLRPAPLPAESYRLELAVRRAGAAEPLPAQTFGGGPTAWLPITWFDVRDPCGCLPPSATPLGQRFADGIGLVGWEARRLGDDLDLALYWRADARPRASYTVFLHALRGDQVVGQVDDQPNGGRRPTADWQPGDVVRDHRRLRAPGATAVRLGLYTSGDGKRLATDPPTPDNALTLALPP
jgi:hypothetical protein